MGIESSLGTFGHFPVILLRWSRILGSSWGAAVSSSGIFGYVSVGLDFLRVSSDISRGGSYLPRVYLIFDVCIGSSSGIF